MSNVVDMKSKRPGADAPKPRPVRIGDRVTWGSRNPENPRSDAVEIFDVSPRGILDDRGMLVTWAGDPLGCNWPPPGPGDELRHEDGTPINIAASVPTTAIIQNTMGVAEMRRHTAQALLYAESVPADPRLDRAQMHLASALSELIRFQQDIKVP